MAPELRRFLSRWNWWPVFIINIVLTLINLVAFTGFGIYYNIKVRPASRAVPGSTYLIRVISYGWAVSMVSQPRQRRLRRGLGSHHSRVGRQSSVRLKLFGTVMLACYDVNPVAIGVPR